MTAEAESTLTAPVTKKERITSIDTLRGVALLGILLLNIIAFAFPFAAYLDPSVDGSTEGINLAAYMTMDIFFEGSMRTIFSMLFGAGLLIFVSKPGADPLRVKALYYRRTWLLVGFGLFNAYILVWPGDILYAYGMAGLILFFFRNLSPKKMTIIASVILVGLMIFHAGLFVNIRMLSNAASEVEALPAGTVLTEEQQSSLDAWSGFQEGMFGTPEMIAEEMTIKKSGYIDNFVASAQANIVTQTVALLAFGIWDALSMMLLGMALMKWGVFDASRSMGFYLKLMLVGFGLGIPLNSWETFSFVNSGFEISGIALARPTYDIGRLLLAFGYIGLVMTICKSGILTRARSALAAVGQMALTNYLSQSIICNFIFMGFGLGLAGELQRYQVFYVVLGVWIFQLILSSWWLKRYRFGPAEWLWRSMTYKHKQAMRL